MKRLLSLILLAFAISLFATSAASAYPVIDPPDAAPAFKPATIQLTDGWYPAALQQTLIDAAKKHPPRYVRPHVISGHGPVLS